MNWSRQTTATIADLAAIELRRIVDVLQVEHASVFLRDDEHPTGAAEVASVGVAADEALVDHADLVARVMRAGDPHDAGRDGCSAIAAPLLDEGEPLGVLLVVTVRESRRLGAFEARLIARAAETLVNRIVAPQRRTSDRFSREQP
jgi:hypothetical protein